MVDPIEKKGRLLVFWGDNVAVSQIVMNEFSMELNTERKDFEGKLWVIFVYLSTEDNVKKRQWEVLKQMKRFRGEQWIIRGTLMIL